MASMGILTRKIESASKLKTVVRTMKALSSANIGQYEMAVSSLREYADNVALGIYACLLKNPKGPLEENPSPAKHVRCSILVGSDLGLVGKFNDTLVEYFLKTTASWEQPHVLWVIGDRIIPLLPPDQSRIEKVYAVPGSVQAITPLVGRVLKDAVSALNTNVIGEYYLFYQKHEGGLGYTPSHQRILPIDQNWLDPFKEREWPTDKLPEVIGKVEKTLLADIEEFLFISLFRAFSESLASENASRLAAMQRAEKNIDKLLERLKKEYHKLRQETIDEELFDIIAGFEALSDTKRKS
jgi:F-type H+-transporting ATPase subunit gamma